MSRNTAVLVGTGFIVIALLGTAIVLSENGTDTQWPGTYGLSFDAGTQDKIGDRWTRHGDVPQNPNTGTPVNWSITTSDRNAASGNYSGLFMIDGLQDDGTIWLQRSIPVDGGTRYAVNVSTKAYSEQESFNVVAHMVQYAGLSEPTQEEDFPQADTINTTGLQAGLRQPLARAAGWEQYSFSWTTPVIEDNTDHIYVAVGLSVVWETQIAFQYDDIEISIEPVDSGQ